MVVLSMVMAVDSSVAPERVVPTEAREALSRALVIRVDAAVFAI
jgi:hypothetical protein